VELDITEIGSEEREMGPEVLYPEQADFRTKRSAECPGAARAHPQPCTRRPWPLNMARQCGNRRHQTNHQRRNTDYNWGKIMCNEGSYLGVTEGDISATLGHSIAVMRAVYSHPLPKERRGGTDAIAVALDGHSRSFAE
jgi:hypothetical protein